MPGIIRATKLPLRTTGSASSSATAAVICAKLASAGRRTKPRSVNSYCPETRRAAIPEPVNKNETAFSGLAPKWSLLLKCLVQESKKQIVTVPFRRQVWRHAVPLELDALSAFDAVERVSGARIDCY